MADEQIRIGLAIISDAGTRKTITEVAEVRKKINELKTEFKAGVKDVDSFTKELAALEKQAKTLDKALDEVGESRRINADTGQLGQQGGAGAGLRKAGRELRNLPSVQIPGAGIGTDAIGNLTRLTGTVIDLSEQSKFAAAATKIFTPALGAQTAATIGAAAPLLALVGVFAAVGAAVKFLADSASQQADRINAFGEKQRELSTRLAEGLTTDKAQSDIDDLTEAMNRNKRLVAQLKSEYEGTQQTTQAAGAFLRVFSGDEEALATQINETNKAITDQEREIASLSGAIETGETAANDAAEAERKLAEERTQNVLSEASQAGELATLKERANELTQEQIDKELEALELRRTGIEAELAALEQSGDTSEAVAQKITQLKDALGLLGEQSDVLKNARKGAKSDAAEKEAEKAKKEAEKEAERQAKAEQKRIEDTAKAHQNYTDKLADARQAFKDTAADIKTSLKDNLADNLTQLNDDLREGTIEFNQDQLAEERAFQRDKAQIQRDSARAEQDAVRQRDFAALAQARQQGADALAERQSAEDAENAEQLIDFQNQRAALSRERDMANRDDLLAAQRAERDNKINRDRAFRDAATDRDRALRDINNIETTHQRNSLNRWQQYYNQLGQLEAQALGKGRGGIGTIKTGGSKSDGAMSFDTALAMVVGS